MSDATPRAANYVIFLLMRRKRVRVHVKKSLRLDTYINCSSKAGTVMQAYKSHCSAWESNITARLWQSRRAPNRRRTAVIVYRYLMPRVLLAFRHEYKDR